MQRNSIIDWIDVLAFPVSVNAILFSAVWLINKKQLKHQTSIKRLIALLVLTNSDADVVLRMSTISALETLGRKKGTVLKLLLLDRQVLLSFASAFVTFNALFVTFV